jgi:glycosyltransferase involved in cell wall biosynthesis
MNNPKVSIIIPVYNVEKYLSKCLDSVLTQTFTDFECILVNDCSLDNSRKICENYAKLDKRIKVIHKTENIGSSQARKTGIENSNGDFIQFVDSDDWIENNMLEKIYEKAISENLDIVIFNYISEKKDIKEIKRQDIFNLNKEAIIKDILAIRIKSFLWNKFVKREVCLQAYFPNLSRSEDYLITIQNVYYAEKIGYLDLPLYHYRHNEESLSNNKERFLLGCIEENKNWCKVVDFLKENYNGNLKLFEPELTNRINSFKKKYITNKETRFNNKLYKLYPESKFYLWLFILYIKKIIKFFIPYGIISLYKKTKNIIISEKLVTN